MSLKPQSRVHECPAEDQATSLPAHSALFNPFTPKSDQFQISPAASPEIAKFFILCDGITQYEELGFSQLTQMADDSSTNSHYLAHTLPFKRLGECTF